MGRDHTKPAPGPLDLIQDYVNTRNYFRGGDLLYDSETTTGWLLGRGLLREGERVHEEERRRLVAFREGLRSLLLSHNGVAGDEPGAEAFDELVESTALRVRFGPGGRPEVEPAPGGGMVGRVFGRLLAEVIRAEAEGTWERLKACRNEECRWAFYDASKNRSGSWCDMAVCGSRHKMRAYRDRKSRSR